MDTDIEIPNYPFLRQAGRILNSGQARSLMLTGNIYDLFFFEGKNEPGTHLPLTEFLIEHWRLDGVILLVYEINGPIRFVREGDLDKVKDAWLRWRTGMDSGEMALHQMLSSGKVSALARGYSADFDLNLRNATGNPTVALEFLRQLCLCSRSHLGEQSLLPENLLVIVEAADLVLPDGEIPSLSDADRHSVSICHDWFSDPGFSAGKDSVVMIAESRSLINQRVARLPQVLEVQVPAPGKADRAHLIDWFERTQPEEKKVQLWGTQQQLADATADLSLHALVQLLRGATHEQRALTQDEVIEKVAGYIKAQLGEDAVEFKRPTHHLDKIVGFAKLKDFIRAELIPRFGTESEYALPGAAVCGAIGSGKTFIFEAVAAELNMVVLVLKGIRSQWYGQTDVIFERLRRVLEALSKVLIFVDEADTQFGGVGPDAHATERRLTGKIQAMMSDSRLRGKVTWLLMTARIHLLSPDIRRPGRVGDLIIPILDPEGDDRRAFLAWMVEDVLGREPTPEELNQLDDAMPDTAAASFAALRSEMRARAHQHTTSLDLAQILDIIRDHIPPAIAETRRYQTLQALVNCTRRQLLPVPEASDAKRAEWAEWAKEIRLLEQRGIR